MIYNKKNETKVGLFCLSILTDGAVTNRRTPGVVLKNISEKKVAFKAIFGYSPHSSPSKPVSSKKQRVQKAPVEATRRSERKKPVVNYCEVSESSDRKSVGFKMNLKIVDININTNVDNNVDNVVNYMCTECNKSYKHRNSLVKHLKCHNKEQYMCNICDKTFNYSANLTRHIVSKHSKSTVEYKCGLCRISFSYSFTLKKHLKKFH